MYVVCHESSLLFVFQLYYIKVSNVLQDSQIYFDDNIANIETILSSLVTFIIMKQVLQQ